MLHYWFSETTNSSLAASADTPVILWLNGGPGSSSVLGMLQEMGPLLMTVEEGGGPGFVLNPYAWTTKAHLLVIESPAGVGYSYCAEMKWGKGCQNTDKKTAASARVALQHFFVKFPELSKNVSLVRAGRRKRQHSKVCADPFPPSSPANITLLVSLALHSRSAFILAILHNGRVVRRRLCPNTHQGDTRQRPRDQHTRYCSGGPLHGQRSAEGQYGHAMVRAQVRARARRRV